MTRFGKLLGFVVVVGAGACLAWWWYHTSQPDYQLRAGMAAAEKGDLEDAQFIADRMEVSGAKDHARLLRGKILVQRGKFDQALLELNLIKEGDLRVDAVLLCGRCHLDLQALDEAERDFLFVLNERPGNLDALRGMAGVMYDLGDYEAAQKYCKQWAEITPGDGRPYRFLGYIQTELGDKVGAISSYKEALRRSLSNAVRQEVLLELADAEVGKSLYLDALSTLKDCDEQTADSPPALTLRAECLLAQDQKPAAIVLLDQALARDPKFSRALQLRAKQHLEQREYASAVGLLERAVEIDPHDFASRNLLAQAYVSLNRPGDAKKQLRLVNETQALLSKLDKLGRELMVRPRDAELHQKMAEVYSKLNNPDQARRNRRAAALFGAPP
jgi:tetratricopeptide (TPR) repeat protein